MQNGTVKLASVHQHGEPTTCDVGLTKRTNSLIAVQISQWQLDFTTHAFVVGHLRYSAELLFFRFSSI